MHFKIWYEWGKCINSFVHQMYQRGKCINVWIDMNWYIHTYNDWASLCVCKNPAYGKISKREREREDSKFKWETLCWKTRSCHYLTNFDIQRRQLHVVQPRSWVPATGDTGVRTCAWPSAGAGPKARLCDIYSSTVASQLSRGAPLKAAPASQGASWCLWPRQRKTKITGREVAV